MALEWKYSIDNLNWEELSKLYPIAPLGQKDPAELKIALLLDDTHTLDEQYEQIKEFFGLQ